MHYKFARNETQIRKTGPEAALTPAEERSLVEWLILSAERGYPQPFWMIRQAVKDLLDNVPRKNGFNNNMPSQNWMQGFMRRHTQLSHRKPESMTPGSGNVKDENLIDWWTFYNQYLIEKDCLSINSDPRRIWNADEITLLYNPKSKKAVADGGGCSVMLTVSKIKHLSLILIYDKRLICLLYHM